MMEIGYEKYYDFGAAVVLVSIVRRTVVRKTRGLSCKDARGAARGSTRSLLLLFFPGFSVPGLMTM